MPIDPANNARQKLLELERRRQMAVIREFSKIKDRLAAEIADLLERIEKERRIDGNASPELLFQKARLNELLDAIETEIRDASDRLAGIATKGQTQAIAVAKSQASGYVELQSNLNFFDSAATRELIGIAGDGQPLAVHFADLASPARAAMFDALFFGIAAGKPNAEIAREIRDALGGTTARAMTIVRTEANRSYREATRKFYNEAPAVIGWRWNAALDLRTCPVCWALHGRVFKLKTKFGTHPNCRCTMTPVFADSPAEPTGPELFAKLTPAQQKTILGPRRFDLYNQGADLGDFVETQKSVFGIGRRVRPLRRTKFKGSPRIPGEPTPVPTPPKKSKPAVTPKPALSARAKAGEPVPVFYTAAEAAEYMERRYPGKVFDFKGMDLRLTNANAAEIARLLDDFPEVAARIEYFGTNGTRGKRPAWDNSRIKSSSYAHHVRDITNTKSSITFNRKFYSDADAFIKAKEYYRKIGFKVADGPTATAVHEFGHAVDYWIRSLGGSPFKFAYADGRNETTDIWIRIVRELKPTPAELSIYGMEDGQEQVAEGFAMMRMRPRSDWPKFVRAMDFFIKYLQSKGTTPNNELLEYRDLTPAEKEKANREFETLIKALGLKLKP